MLVIMKNGNLHALAKFALHIEAFRGLDVLQIDATETGFQAGNDVDQFVGIALADLEVEDVDTRELLEQYPFTFHHWLGRQRPDRTQTQYRGAVADHRDQVAARGDVTRLSGIIDDGFAGRRHAGRIGERQIPLVGQRFGWYHFDLAGNGEAVIMKGLVVKIVTHQNNSDSNCIVRRNVGVKI
jgi:hypothetical protein